MNLNVSLLLLLLPLVASAQESVEFWTVSRGPFGANVRNLVSFAGGRVLAGTQHGLYLSDDDGRTWRPTNLALHDSLILAMTVYDHRTVLVSMPDGALWRSNDRGTSWRALARQATPARSFALGLDGTLYAATYATLMRSVDTGATWSRVDTLREIDAVHIAFRTADSPAGVLLASGRGLLRRSSDGGVSWATSPAPLLEGWMTTLSETDGGDLVATFRSYGIGVVARSTDLGATWKPFAPTSWPMTVHTIAPDGALVAASADGVFRSIDDGDTWSTVGYAPFTAFEVASFVVTDAGTILAGSFDGVHRSLDNGRTWSPSAEAMTAGVGNAITVMPDGVLLADMGRSVFGTSDLGDTWYRTDVRAHVHALLSTEHGRLLVLVNGAIATTDDVRGPFTGENLRALFAAHQIARVDDSTYVAVSLQTAEVFRSTDSGMTWRRLKHPFSTYGINAVAATPDGKLFIFGESTLYRSTNAGDSWTAVVERIGSANGGAMIAAPDGSLVFGSSGGQLYRVRQESWSIERIGSDLGRIRSIVATLDGAMYVATDDRGALRSIDGGRTWQQLAGPRSVHTIRALVLHPSGYLFANTWGGSVLRSRERIATAPAGVEMRERPSEMNLSEARPRN